MMNYRILSFVALSFLLLVGSACGDPTPIPNPPDTSIETAIAATLTAQTQIDTHVAATLTAVAAEAPTTIDTPAPPPVTPLPPTPPPPAITPQPAPKAASPLVAKIVHPTHHGSKVEGELFFQVEAYDPGVGTWDGAGIAHVDMLVFDSHNQKVYNKREQNPAYCWRGGGEPHCNRYNFAKNGYQWPNGRNVQAGSHTLKVIVTANDGRQTTVQTMVHIERPSHKLPLEARIVQPTHGTVKDELFFQVEAYDPGVGTRDGTGIAYVDMLVFDSHNQQVYSKREQNPAYCWKGGGEPHCNQYNFAEHGYQWSKNGPKVQAGSHTLKAIVTANDGRQTTVQTTVHIER